MHRYLVREVMFFKTLSEHHSLGFLTKIYEVLELRHYEKGDVLCSYGEMGDTFYIILNGDVSVQVPTRFEHTCHSFVEMLQFVIDNLAVLHRLSDFLARDIRKLVEVVGVRMMMKQGLSTDAELAKFCEELATLEPELLAARYIKLTKELQDN